MEEGKLKNIILAPNPTGTGHNMRMLAIGQRLLSKYPEMQITVLLGSRQDIFTSLFKQAGIKVFDLSPTGIIDYSKGSHLSKDLNWKNMISEYFVPTFFNGDKVLKYLDIIDNINADLIISDYNINATFAAIIAKIKNVFVTERHNFTLVDIKLEDLKTGGFNVNDSDMLKAKKVLNKLFDRMSNGTDLILTDKVILPDFDPQNVINNSKYKFVGSIYKDRTALVPDPTFDYYSEYIIGTVSNTTMIEADKETNINVYISTYRQLKKKNKNLKLVIVGEQGGRPDIDGVSFITYAPNWTKLIQNAKLLWSHPGWISVTEVAKLGIKTVFYLPSFMEYHEVEAFNRLKFIGLPTFVGGDTRVCLKTR